MNDKHLKIIMAAKDIFEEEGYHEAKISEIAKRAGVGKGTVYEYFDSKQSLFEEMVVFLIDMGFETMEAKIKEQNNAIDKLKVIVEIEKEISLNHGKLFGLILARLSSASDMLKNKFYETRERELRNIEDIVSDGIQAGTFKEVNTHYFALIFKGAISQAHMSVNCNVAKGSEINEALHISDDLFEVLLDSIKS